MFSATTPLVDELDVDCLFALFCIHVHQAIVITVYLRYPSLHPERKKMLILFFPPVFRPAANQCPSQNWVRL